MSLPARAAVLLVLALAGTTSVSFAAVAAKKAAPAPFVDDEHGFQILLADGWQRVEQDTGAAGAAGTPIYKAANDRTGQWLVVISTKGPTDDADGDGAAALANFESGFSGATGYKRLSLQRKDVAPGKPPRGARVPAGTPKKTPAVDLWFTMQRDGKPVVVGARGLMFRSYVLTLVVDAPGTKVPSATRRMLESFAPSPPVAD